MKLNVSLGQMNVSLGQPQRNLDKVRAMTAEARRRGSEPVSYTHLTLPTILLV